MKNFRLPQLIPNLKTAEDKGLVEVRITALEDGGVVGSNLDTRLTAAEGDIDVLQQNAGEVAAATDTGRTFLTKAIKRKIITVAAGPNASTVHTAHGLTMVRVLRADFLLKNGTNHLCFGQGGMLGDTLLHSIIVAIDGTNVDMTSGAGGDYSAYAGYLELEYTDA